MDVEREDSRYDIQFPPSSTHSELLQKIRTTLKGQHPLLKREFVDVSCNQNSLDLPVSSKGYAPSQPVTVRVLQWNHLARALSHGDDNFIKCPKEALKWERRRLHILEEVVQYEPDVICLEEVDQFDFIKSALGSIGFEGTFFPKPDSPCLAMEESYGPDGCAIFHNAKKLKSINIQNVNLKIGPKTTNQVAIIQQLQNTDSEHPLEFYIGVTHLKSKVGMEETRLLQGKDLLNTLMDSVGNSPLILSGDFNAVPEEPVYSALKSSSMDLDSAYTKLSANGSEPPYTTWKVRGGSDSGEVCRTEDYIWYTRNIVTVQKLLRFPTGEDIGPGRLPCINYPSDHLSLVADFNIY